MKERGGIVINMTSGPLPGDPPNQALPEKAIRGLRYPVSKAGLQSNDPSAREGTAITRIAVISLHPGRVLVERSPFD